MSQTYTELQVLRVGNGGTKGLWEAPEFCPKGTYSAGYELKVPVLNQITRPDVDICLTYK